MKAYQADVVICGAGTAGLPAALSAARNGLSVILVEDDTVIGGACVDMGIQMWVGEPYMQGYCGELKRKMREIAPQGSNTTCFRSSTYLLAWNELFSGLDINIHTGQKLVKVEMDDNRIVSVESETVRFEAKIFIDATGNGDIAAQTPCEWRYGREAKSEYNEKFAPEKADNKVQCCTLMYTARRLPECTHNEHANWAFFEGGEYLIWGPQVVCEDPLNPGKLREANQKAFSMMEKEREKMREKGFYITSVAPKIGLRETRRIVGDYFLSYNDIIDRREFYDSIGINKGIIDPWDPDGNPYHNDKTANDCYVPYYEIPYRCLVTKKVANMIVAGRCTSSTHVVNSSIRTQDPCIIMGQAAGNAAKMAIDSNLPVSDIDGAKLSAIMREQAVHTSLFDFEKRENVG